MTSVLAYMQVLLAIQANSFLYYFRKIPSLGQIFTRALRSGSHAKEILALPGAIFTLARASLRKLLLALIFLQGLPGWLVERNWIPSFNSTDQLVWFVLLFCLMPAVAKCELFAGQKEDYLFLHHFQLDPSPYYKTKISIRMLTDLITYLPVLVLLFSEPRIWLSALLLKLIIILLAQCFYLWFFGRTQGMPGKMIRYLLLTLLFITYLVILSRFRFIFSLSLPYLAIAAGIILIITGFYLMRNKLYRQVSLHYGTQERLGLHIAVGTGLTSDDREINVGTPESNQAWAEAHENLSSVAYLHESFLHRNSKVFTRFRKQMLIVNALVSVVLIAVLRFGLLEIEAGQLLSYTPVLFSWTLFQTSGAYYTQLCFRQLDLPFLYYRLYTKQDIQALFLLRLKHVCQKGLLPLVSLGIGLFLINSLGGLSLPLPTIAGLFGICLLLFVIFELYHLLAYFLIQPYTKDLLNQSPVFTLLKVAEWVLVIGFFVVRGNLADYWPPFAVVLLLELGLLALFFRSADKTFRLRRDW